MSVATTVASPDCVGAHASIAGKPAACAARLGSKSAGAVEHYHASMGAAGAGFRARVLTMMEQHWQPPFGWSVPNPEVYSWLWSWDSCFHALVWDALGDKRALTELSSVFRAQTRSGFVPHINYAADPTAFEEFWGVPGASTLCQPPMYGHVLAVLQMHGGDIGPLIEPALRGMRRLFEQRMAPCGLLRIYHPWESGIDDSPRWEAYQPDPWDRTAWYGIKGQLAGALLVEDGEAVASDAFDVCSAGFNALAAWTGRQLAAIAHDAELDRHAAALAARLDEQWDEKLLTWVDAAPDGASGSAVRTLDALLPALVTRHPARAESALRSVMDAKAFGLPFGPAGVHVDEPSFDPTGYGRGSAWPNLTYLSWAMARERGRREDAAQLARMLRAGAEASELAEYWDPRDGSGLGARPQAWAGLAIVTDAE
jgi:hypothetical protein